MPSEAEIAWAAGFFEGEGSAGVYIDYRRPHLPGSPRASLSQNDEGPVRRFQQIVGMGSVSLIGPYPSRPKPVWFWQCTNRKDLPRLVTLMPWLSPRRRAQIQSVLDAC